MDLIVNRKRLNSSKEIELNFDTPEYPFGVNVRLTYTEESPYSAITMFNVTEVHNRYNENMIKRLTDEHGSACGVLPGIATESDIHCHGGTTELKELKSVVVFTATSRHTWYYAGMDHES